MAFIAYLENSFLAIGKEYLRVDKNTIAGCHTPYSATVFESKNEAESIFNERFSRYEDITLTSDVNAHLAEFDSWLESGGVYRELPMLHPLNRPYNGEDKDGVLKWNFDVTNLKEGEIRSKEANTWPELSTLFKCIYQTLSFNCMKDSNATKISVEMYVKKDTDFSTFKEELLKVIPFISHIDDEGFLVIRVFEHTLCQFGSIYAYVKPELSSFKIGSQFCDREYENMEEFFEKWKSEHYYE